MTHPTDETQILIRIETFETINGSTHLIARTLGLATAPNQEIHKVHIIDTDGKRIIDWTTPQWQNKPPTKQDSGAPSEQSSSESSS